MAIASATKNVEVPLVKEKDNICEEADLVLIQVL